MMSLPPTSRGGSAPATKSPRTSIGNGLLALHRHPAQWAQLTARPSRAAAAVEEVLRFDSSVQLTSRKAFETVALSEGTVIARGESGLCLLGAANGDPDA
jgi:cytochrome P450